MKKYKLALIFLFFFSTLFYTKAQTENQITTSKSEGCVPFTVNIKNKNRKAINSKWVIDRNEFDKRKLSYTFTKAGKYEIVLNEKDETGKLLSHSKTIIVHPKPDAKITVVQNVKTDEKIVRLKTDADESYSTIWDMGDGESITGHEVTHKYFKSADYTVHLTIENQYGCAATISKTQYLDGYYNNYKSDTLMFPNAFAPFLDGSNGGDYLQGIGEGTNRVFHPTYADIDEFTMQIFNKNGFQLFETEDVDVGWDGYYDNKLCPQDGYIYMAWGHFSNGMSFNQIGQFILIHK